MSGLLNLPMCQKFIKKVLHTILPFVAALILSGTLKAQNNSLNFDGVDDYVNLGALTPPGNFSTGFTFMGWVKWSSYNFYAPVFVFGDGLNSNDNANTISLSGYATENGIAVRCSNSTLIIPACTALDQWVHIAITVTETGHVTAYINGSNRSMFDVNAILNVAKTTCTLGSPYWYKKFNGSLDEISIWSRALTITEIQNKMNTSLAGNETGLYSYYRFNQGAPGGTNTICSTLTDAGINAKNGTLTNFALSGTTSNWLSSSIPVTINNNTLAFDGTNDFVNLSTMSPAGNFSTGFTFMSWVKWGAFNSWARLFDFGTGAGYNNIMLATGSTTNSLTLSNYLNTTPYQLSTGNILSPNQWVHVATTISNTGAAKIYINGVVAASGNVSAPVNIARNLSYLGKSNWVSDGYLNASMDETSIWTRALTADEINTGMNNSLNGGETGLYSYYNFNQGAAGGTNTGLSTLYDATANLKNGTITNSSLTGTASNWVSSIVPLSTQNNALSFDGTNDFVAIPALGSNLTQFTIETWFNAANFLSAPFSGIFNTNGWSTGDVHFQITGTTIQLAVCNSTVASASFSFSPNTWYHLAATYNASTKKVNIYVNGTLVQNITLATAFNANFTAAEIGAYGATRYFAGKLDQYRIWNSERTAADISNNMFKSYNGTESGLLGYFNFNEGVAAAANAGVTTLVNAIGINHGTLNNFALSGATSNWVTGLKETPGSHVSNFIGSVISSKMTLKWNDVINSNSPDGYYIYASKTNSFVDPVNGTEPANDNNLSDGAGVVKVLQGTQIYDGWINDELNIPYYFRIYPYTNSGLNTLYYTAATVPQVQITSAGEFSLQDGIPFPATQYGASAWGDYNNDGNLDLILSGDSSSIPITRIFKGNGLGGFTPQYQIKMRGLQYASVAWGDYNNDGYLDLILTGSDRSAWPPTSYSRIYKNNKNETFTEQTQIELFPVYNGSAVWGDYDNDGDLDILLTGNSAAKIYINNGDNSFTDKISLIGVTYGNTLWSDFDNDGFLDLVYSGIDQQGNGTVKFYRNNGDNTFSLKTNTGLPNSLGAVAGGDFNNDGLTDLFLGNYDNSKIFRNTGNCTFTELTTVAAAAENTSVSWIDYDIDGFLDLMVSGHESGTMNSFIKLYRNTDGNTFTEVTQQSWPNAWGNVTWADYDNDNRLDFIITGYGTTFNGVYHNNIKTFNTAPPVPESLSITKDVRTATFRWVYPKLAERAKFNLRIGSSTGSSSIVSSQSLANGNRLLQNNTTLLRDTSFTLNPLKVGNYFWSVQAVDVNGKASAFAPEQTFSVDSIQSSGLVASNVNSTTLKLKWKRGNGDGCIVFFKANKSSVSKPEHGVIYKHSSRFGEGSRIAGTEWFCVYNGQADSVLVSGLNPAVTYTVHVVEYLTTGTSDKYFRTIVDDNLGFFSTSLFTDMQNLTSEGVLSGSAEWGDYDNDGYLDILATGVVVENLFYAKIYHNNGDNTFTTLDSFTFLLPDNAITRYYDRYMGKWADFNNDGYLDILIVDSYNFGTAKVYRNNHDISGTTFPLQVDFGADFSTGTVEDLNNDGYLDIVLSGKNDTRIYKNNKDFTFTLQTTIPFMTYNSSLDCGDFNNDGLSDILLTGYHKIAEYNFSGASKLYQNNGNWEFNEKTDISLTGISYGTGLLMDYDNDGYKDILLSGSRSYSEGSASLIYHNERNGNFTLVANSGIAGLQDVSADWGDYNNDGYSDLAITGQGGGLFTKVYTSNKNGTFTEDTGFSLVGSYKATTKWCDYDNDGDLDILFAGNKSLKIYQNTTTSIAGKYSINRKPAAPANLASLVAPNKVTLSWSPVENDETPSISMSYNLRFRTVGSTDWKSAPKSVDTMRLVNSAGNIHLNTRISMSNLPVGQYEWSVQAVDQGYKGGFWSANQTFEIRDLQTFFNSETVCLGVPTNFTDQSVSTDGITAWKWDFNDGMTSAVQNPAHTFTSSGSFNVKLVITSTSGAKDSLINIVTVKPKPLTAFTAPATCLGSAAIITNTTVSNGLTISSWEWSFGDDLVSSDQQPSSHPYLLAKDYQVKLKASASNGCADSVTNVVTVGSIPIALVTANAPLTFCKGDSVTLSVPYNKSFIYNWKNDGTSITGADSSGYVAKLNGAYTVEVINTKGNCPANSSAVNVTARNAPEAPLIINEGTLQFCQGDSVKLSVTAVAGYEYNWKLNGGAVGLKANQYYAKNTGKYNLIVANSNGCSVASSNEVDVLVKPIPAASSISRSGDIQFCEGGSVVLSVPSTSGNLYKWKDEYGLVPGEESNSFTANKTGSFHLEISNSTGCAVNTSPVNVVVKKMPVKPVLLTDNYTPGACLGKNPVRLSASEPVSGYSYQWYKNTSPITNATSSYMEGFLTQGEYRLTAELNSCSVQSDAVTISFDDAPAKPMLHAYGPTIWYLTCSDTSATKYMWYYNGSLIEENGKQNYVAYQKLGVYNVSVSNAKGCYTMSDAITIPTGTVGVEETNIFDELTIYPNPTSGQFRIVVDNQYYGEMLISILDQGGKTVANMKSEKTTDFHSIPFDLSSLSKGIYFITIRSGKLSVNKKIILQ